jgi:hypothetical protein
MSAEASPPRRSERQPPTLWWVVLFLAICTVVTLGLVARWDWANRGEGAAFQPRPDALEYAASAQSLAQSGRFLLQVGPVQAPPHYSPGWPLVLAALSYLGVQPSVLWRATGLVGVALALLLGASSLWLVKTTALASSSTEAPRWWASLLAGTVAAVIWALAPPAVDAGKSLMSDEPAVFTGLLAVALSAAVVLGRARSVWYIGSGFAWALLTAIRPIEGVLLGSPMLGLLAVNDRPSLGTTVKTLLLLVTGSLPVVVLVAIVLVRSGSPAWQWTNYDYWNPGGVVLFPGGFPSAGEVVRAVVGWPGDAPGWDLGPVWPFFGWLTAAWVITRKRVPMRDPLRAACLMALLWTGVRVAVFAAYFYAAPRFLLAGYASVLTLASALVGIWFLRSRRKWAPSLVAAALVTVTGWSLALYCVSLPRRLPPSEHLFRRFNRWIALDDDERVGREMPFDPLVAQAMGLLDPATVTQIHEWGTLPSTFHVRRLRRRRLLPQAVDVDPER